MFMEKNRMFEDKTQAEIVATALRTRNSEMEKELKRLSTENKRLRESGSTTVAKPGQPRDNFPSVPLEGSVMRSDETGLMQISLGSDDGLQRGHTLELFRLNPAAYLGRVKIIEVNPKDAVAQPVGQLNGKPGKGDKVASQIR
jgi:hypothetical protein